MNINILVMKQSLLIVTCLLIQLSLKAQDVPQTQSTLLIKKTATWCSNCGSWGWDFFKDILDDNSGQALLMAAHYSGNLMTSAAVDLSDNANGSGQPVFFLNETDINVGRNSTSTKRTEVRTSVETRATESPVANAIAKARIEGNKIIVETTTKFFQEVEGNYAVAVYLMEDNVIAFQQSQGNDADHRLVLRGSGNGESFGTNMGQTNIAAETEFKHNFDLDLFPDYNTNKLQIYTVVWKLGTPKHQFINGTKTSNLNSLTSVGDRESNEGLKAFTYNSGDHMVLVIDEVTTAQDVRIEAVSLDGKNLLTVYNGFLSEGRSEFNISKGMTLGAGIYAIRISTDAGEQTLLTLGN